MQKNIPITLVYIVLYLFRINYRKARFKTQQVFSFCNLPVKKRVTAGKCYS